MRKIALLLAALSAPTAARACDPVVSECLPTVVAYPAYTPEGIRVGTVVAQVVQPQRLERSRFTGQPLPVVFNSPGSLPGSISPRLALVPLPRVSRFHTQAVYPRGY